MKAKIFFVCSSLNSGGAERVLSILSRPLADRYSNVEYIMWKDQPVFYNIDNRIKLVNIEKECGSRNLRKRMLWFRKYVNKSNPNLILSFSAPFNMLTIASLLFTNHRIIACERVDPRSFRWGRHFEIARNLLYRKAFGILAQTQMSKEYFKGNLFRKTQVIYNPITMSLNDVGSALNTKKSNTIVTAGRLVSQKRHDLLIKSFSKFKTTHPDYQLIIYGEGTEKEKLISLTKKLGLFKDVSFPGNAKDLWEKIKSAKMFVMSSDFEGMSNSMIESMCLGIPTISTRVSGATDLIQNNHNGILIDTGDDEALYQSLCKVADNEGFASKLGQNGTKLYNKLSVDVISKEWLDYIDFNVE